jgi:hypothetical protein
VATSGAGLGLEQPIQFFAHALHQRAWVRAGGEGAQQPGDALVERVALVEEQALDPRPQPVVRRDHHRGEQEREGDLPRARVDPPSSEENSPNCGTATRPVQSRTPSTTW